MGSYGVIKEALLVKQKGSTAEFSVVQKLVPATVNGMVSTNENGGFVYEGQPASIHSVYRGGAFGFSEGSKNGQILVSINIPGYGVKYFFGVPIIKKWNGVGNGVMCTPLVSDPNAPYTHLCLVVESPGPAFAETK